MEKQNLENLAVGGKNEFPHGDKVKEQLMMWNNLPDNMELQPVDKEINEKTLQEIIKEVAIEEGMTEEEVRRHLERFQAMNLPKAKTKKEKAKAKSKRKMAKKSRKKNR
ncbi:hypothetical protein [Bacillus phage vB_BanS-Thrax3]|nr:hypothetical protein [Bacillus phage vB_BanS-Thrax3]